MRPPDWFETLEEARAELQGRKAQLFASEKERLRLRDALIAMHACATLRSDGTCDGCPVSEALGRPAAGDA